MALKKTDNKILPLNVTPLTLTTSWQDIGAANAGPFVDFKDCLSIALWLRLDINDSSGIQIRMLAADSEIGQLYDLPIKDVQAAVVNVAPDVLELSNDVDQNIVMSFPVSDQLPLGKFQVRAAVAGATPGTVVGGVTFTSNAGAV